MSNAPEERDDPYAITLTQREIHTLAFPGGNYGYGVLVEPSQGQWELTAAPRPASRRKPRRRSRPPKPSPPPIHLDEVVLTRHKVAARHQDNHERYDVDGHWDLSGAWRTRATEPWPFGGELRPWSERGDAPLIACLPGSDQVFIPRIPTFEEMRAWLVDQKLTAPAWECGCGQIHHAGGPVVGLWIVTYEGNGPLRGSTNLIAQEDPHERFRGCIPETVLDLHACALLNHIEDGGHRPLWWNKHHGDTKAKNQAQVILTAEAQRNQEYLLQQAERRPAAES